MLAISPEQAPVLEHERGNLLVTGPPGSGKTVLLRERFARLVEAGADPERIGFFVLSRRSAREARDHLIHRLGRSVADLPVFTAHGYAFRVIGSRFAELGYEAPPQVLSAPEQYAVVRDMLTDGQPGEWPRFGRLLGLHGFARELADFVLRAQERLLDPEGLADAIGGGRGEAPELVAFYSRYLEVLGSAGQTDFAGLLFQVASLLSRAGGGEQPFDHLLVDDYQDATIASEAIVRALAPGAGSAVVAADPHGHVFSYRGGSLEPLGRVDTALGGVRRVELATIHRAGVPPLAALDDPSAEPGAGSARPDARLFAHPGEEAEAVAHELVRRRVDEDVPWEEMAVLMRRYGGYLTAMRHALVRHRVPFIVVAEEAAVAGEPANRPVLDLLRYAFRPDSREELLEPVLGSTIIGLAPHDLRRLRREARRLEVPLLALVESGELDELPADLRAPVAELRSLIGELPQVALARGPSGAFFWLWTRVPVFADLVRDGERHRDLDALAALGGVVARFAERRPGAGVQDFLDTLDAAEFGPDPWVPPEERHPSAVRLISAHRAQGLEFEVVLVAGCLEGEFPSLSHRYPLADLERLVAPVSAAERLRARLAEERALFRLAVSRARRATVLFASHSSGARDPRTPSRFAARVGATWPEAVTAAPPAASLRQMEGELRGTLADLGRAPAARLAALVALPAAGASPSSWWGWREWTDPGIPLHEGELRTSYSRLSTLQNCGLQYLYRVELGLDPDPTWQMWLGKLVHDVIDRVQRGEIPRDADAMDAAVEAGWEPTRFPNRAVEHRRRLDARQMIERWIEGEMDGPVRSEVQFEYPIDGAVMRGRIDAIFGMQNGHLRVVDYKTSRYPPTKEEAQHDLQLAAYYLAIKRDPELSSLGDPRYLQLAYLGKGDARSVFARRDASPNAIPDYEGWAESTLKDLLGRVREEDFAPSPEADCMFCSFKPICPMWPEGREAPT